jgi:hypothetical protein
VTALWLLAALAVWWYAGVTKVRQLSPVYGSQYNAVHLPTMPLTHAVWLFAYSKRWFCSCFVSVQQHGICAVLWKGCCEDA